jgi:uncharacterized membrane protein YkoI/protein tyrosine phosphatase (PTP) superfamily phosphohydrolase (DUF442 family)
MLSAKLPRNGLARRIRAAQLLGLLCALLLAPTAGLAQQSREAVEGVTNFGRVTDKYFRGGKLTTQGIENLAKMGVKTIVDLRDKPSPGEKETCERLGITYYKFPMSTAVAPDPATLDKVLSIITTTDAPVYVHCSAGKHRAGTVCATYRMKVQGWTAEKAWEEQKAYGFGVPSEHPALFAYLYGRTSVASGDAVTSATSGAGAQSAPAPVAMATTKEPHDESPTAAAIPDADDLISPDKAIEQARENGAEGEVYKIDLEYDPERSLATWDVTFATGKEYEFDAASGKLLAVKERPAAKMAVLAPLGVAKKVKKTFKSFEDIIDDTVEASGKQVSEMELKNVRGHDTPVFEVVLVDGTTLFYNARTGDRIEGL